MKSHSSHCLTVRRLNGSYSCATAGLVAHHAQPSNGVPSLLPSLTHSPVGVRGVVAYITNGRLKVALIFNANLRGHFYNLLSLSTWRQQELRQYQRYEPPHCSRSTDSSDTQGHLQIWYGRKRPCVHSLHCGNTHACAAPNQSMEYCRFRACTLQQAAP